MAKAAQEFSVTKALLTWMLLEDRRVAHERGQAAAAGAITERLGKLHGFAFDPSKNDKFRLPHQVAQSARCSTSRR